MPSSLLIRPAAPADRPLLRCAVTELQEYEHLRHATRQPGEQVADAYLEWMLPRVEASGAVLVAERDGSFAGFVAGWAEEAANIGETPESNRFGHISDLCVMLAYRGQRIATQLLGGIEQCLSRAGVTRLRIIALAVNVSACTSYEHAGFVPYEITYEKPVGGERRRRPSNWLRSGIKPTSPLAWVRSTWLRCWSLPPARARPCAL